MTYIGIVPLIPLILGVVLVFVIHHLFKRSQSGSSFARWVLGGGMIVSLLLASRVFGGRVLYAFIPSIQRWMVGGGSARAEGASRQAPARSTTAMTREEAAMILGLEANASSDEVKTAYKELMLKLHPDQGGNDYLAGKLNAAKETLLG